MTIFALTTRAFDLTGVHPVATVDASEPEIAAVFGSPSSICSPRPDARPGWIFTSAHDGRPVTLYCIKGALQTFVGSYNDSIVPRFVQWLSKHLDEAKNRSLHNFVETLPESDESEMSEDTSEIWLRRAQEREEA